MSRKQALQGPSRLSKILTHLEASPRLALPQLKALRVSLAFQNDHFGARHFVKEQLPRIRWANPTLDIQVERALKTEKQQWKPEMELVFTNGQQKTIDIHEKWSTTIVKELMEVAGGDPWKKWKAEALLAGTPVVPGEEAEQPIKKRVDSSKLPSLNAFRATSAPSKTSTPNTSNSTSQPPLTATA
ncbi:hypothetical protein BDN72DRAFT_837307 [Pluteus cervinus]|uniref:Uncharacterized protein n=1 Tax=Pluteus cervinus TaxID=181527 RepID=A0ACD3B125_9AGAR|nr:hypothetical protein BDN72DRAFT_837307 [Pluteus cervinus]